MTRLVKISLGLSNYNSWSICLGLQVNKNVNLEIHREFIKTFQRLRIFDFQVFQRVDIFTKIRNNKSINLCIIYRAREIFILRAGADAA